SDGYFFGLNGVERVLGYLGNPDEGVLETRYFGTTTQTPPDGVDVVIGALAPLRANAPLVGAVTDVRAGPGPIPDGGAVVSTQGRNAVQVRDAQVAPGDQVTFRADVDDPDFATATWAAGGGPWIVQNGQGLPRETMQAEAFSRWHIDAVLPRTAIAHTA